MLALFVLDTKYKVVDSPGTPDIRQSVAHAEALQCPDAVLIYPVCPAKASPIKVGTKTVQVVAFELGGDLEEAGSELVRSLSPLVGFGGLGMS